MLYKNKIHSLEDLIAHGVEPEACETDDYLYLWPIDPDRGKYDSSLYKFNKKTKELTRESSIVGVIAELNKAVGIKVDTDYLKQYL